MSSGNSDIAIHVDDVSKVYRIGLKENLNDSLLQSAIDLVRSPLKNLKKYRSLYKFNDALKARNNAMAQMPEDILWALRDVSFKVERGKAVGIIGRNGAGKSTLLKIMSQITYPTLGVVKIRGRVSSLLEVGTGFHQELTGLENIYLNGTILGMKKREIDQKLDEIIDFSGVGKFINTPVKRYSSGMRIRLGFAVAAHIDPEILIIDEVLAVGDAEFQSKCLGKMGQVVHEGRTVIFVSHNMGAITDLCDEAIWIDNGQVRLIGPSREVVSAYLNAGEKAQGIWVPSADTASETRELRFRSLKLLDDKNEPTAYVDHDGEARMEVAFDIPAPVRCITVTCQIHNAQGSLVFETMTSDRDDYKDIQWEPGHYIADCLLKNHLLLPGRYSISIVAFIERVKIIERRENILAFDVTNVGYTLNPKRLGVVAPIFQWNVNPAVDVQQTPDRPAARYSRSTIN
jgi:lipopolysaccharide transport system ATP-binding protein